MVEKITAEGPSAHSTVRGLPGLVLGVLEDDRLVSGSPVARCLLGATTTPGAGGVQSLLVPRHRARWREAVAAATAGPGVDVGPVDLRFAHAPDRSWEARLRAEPPAPRRVHVALREMTRREATLRLLAHRATHDSLTGLPGRAVFEDRWRRARERTRRDGGRVEVYLCDVDGLKAVNDRHGHAAGDAVIRAVSSMLRQHVRPGDVVARIGGDEFGLLVERALAPAPFADPSGPVDPAERFADRLRTCLPAGEGDGAGLRLSVGWVPDDLVSAPADLLARADAHMYRDKRAHRR
ncbi:GGDEF domain-containing protein [Kineococcus gynurae]|uniref:GGDEF domain-containing protein n=1 Tax=Kineococcus gynurae TaxID=452979 RepID=A0ABV5LRS9_9ACTN